jgi:type II secretory pathway component PulF
MPSFTFQARDIAGRRQQGALEAANQGAAAQIIRQRGWRIVSVQVALHEATLGEQLAKLNPLEHLPPRSIDIELSCKQLAVMLRGGLTLLTSLQAVATQASRASLRRAWAKVAERLQEGAGFAEAMVEVDCFPKLLIQLVRIGEQTGHLEQSIDRAAETLEGRRRLRTNLLTALSYPTLVFFAAIGVTAYMVVAVIPKLRVFLDSMGRKLPAMTQMLVDVSEFTQVHLVQFLVGTVALTVGSILLYCHPSGRFGVDRWLLRVPVLGNLFRLAGTASFARALGIMLRSGITLLEGLRTAEGLLHNRFLASRVTAARQAVMQGGNLTDPLAAKYAFCPMLARMVAVGESAGTLDDVLDEVALFHESQLQAAIRQLSVIVEPCIIVVVGGIVGFVYISFFMALFSAGGA